MGKYRVIESNILTPKINQDFKVALISDSHFLNHDYDSTGQLDINQEAFLNGLVDNINELNVDFVIWNGDLTNLYNFLSDDKNSKMIANAMRRLRVPVLISEGNHDSFENGPTKDKPWLDRTNEYHEIRKQFLVKEQLENVFFLDSKGITFGKFNVAFYEIQKGSYKLYETDHENRQAAIEAFNEALRKIQANPDVCNVGAMHSPIWNVKNGKYLTARDIAFYGFFEAIVCAHMHNGATPEPLEKIMPQNRGLVGPHTIVDPKQILAHPIKAALSFFPTDCRGEYCERSKPITVEQIMESLQKIKNPGDLIKTLTLFARSKEDLQVISDIAKSPDSLSKIYSFILNNVQQETLPLLIISQGLKAFPETKSLWAKLNTKYNHFIHLLNFNPISTVEINRLVTLYGTNPKALDKPQTQFVKRYGNPIRKTS